MLISASEIRPGLVLVLFNMETGVNCETNEELNSSTTYLHKSLKHMR